MPQGQFDPSRPRPRAPGAAGLLRGRLLDSLAPLADSPLALVVAPPGWGKTTLMAQYAQRFDGHVVWYRAEPDAARPTDVLDHLVHSLGGGNRRPGLTTPESALAEVEHFGAEVLLVVDDLHALGAAGTDTILERLVLLGPPNLHVLVGSRRQPRFNLSRLELGSAPILDEAVLRFRWWEVDRLFTEVYGEPLHPEDTLPLTRLTDGWPAGLHLLHLGTRGRPLAERRRALAGDGTRLVRGYLEREVLEALPAELVDFLTRTSVLDVLTAERCDELLAGGGSRRRLEELSFHHAVSRLGYDGRAYRCTELLRQVLRARLTERLGSEAARAHNARAAALLAAQEAPAEAIAAAARAGDFDQVRRLLDEHGSRLVTPEPGSWAEVLPADRFADHPALALEAATRKLRNGQLTEAATAYRQLLDRVGAGAGDGAAGQVEGANAALLRRCRRELRLATMWGPAEPAGTREHWADWLRAVAWGEPAAVAADPALMPGPAGLLVRGLAAGIAGDYRSAYTALRRCRIEAAEGDGLVATAAEVGLTLLSVADGGGEWTAHVQAVAHNAERHDHPWLARVARAMLALGRQPEDADQARLVGAECDRLGDDWGGALAVAVEAIRQIRAGAVDLATLTDLERRFRLVGCGSLQAWAHAVRALATANAGMGEASADAAGAEAFARSVGVPAAQAIAYCALAMANPSAREDYVELARATADYSGMSWASLQPLVAALGGAGLGAGSGPAGAGLGGGVGSGLGSGLGGGPGGTGAGASGVAGGRGTAGAAGPGWIAPGTGGGLPAGRMPGGGLPAGRMPGGAGDMRQPLGGSHLREPSLVVRCFGSFEFTLAGRSLDWSAVRPRARALLRLLAIQAGRAVHREDLLEALWPDLPPAGGMRNLQVAVSSLRTFLEPGAPRGSSRLVVRDGEAYLLAVPADGTSDVVAFNEMSREGKRARAVGRHESAAEALQAALGQYTGDLLPEDGPAEWVVAERERYRREAAEVAWALADVELSRGNPLPAAEAALRSLDIDPFRDSSWRTLIAAYEQAGDAAAAKRAQKGYADMLSSLGVSGTWRPGGDTPGTPRRQVGPSSVASR